jgi:hypothetical protein
MNYQELERKVFDWGVDRGIVQNAKPMGQAIKCLEEVTELIDALNRGSESDIRDALGDVWVTLVMTAATMDMDLQECMRGAYMQIKDRKGFLRQDGVFVKDSS